MRDTIFILGFVFVVSLSLHVRKLSSKYLKGEYKQNLNLYFTSFSDYKYENKKGITLKRLSTFIFIVGWLILCVFVLLTS